MTKSSATSVRRYNKLVRDKIPGIIFAQHQEPVTSTLNHEDFLVALRKKLVEEVLEYQHDKTVEELADILEVVYTLARTHGTTLEELETIRKDKAIEKGGFEKRIFLKHVLVTQTH